MITIGNIKSAGRYDLRNDCRRNRLLRLQVTDDRVCLYLLFLRQIIDGRSMLAADIVTLAIECGRAMDGEEYLQ